MSSKRRKGFRRRVGFEERNRFIVVAMEGAETEPRYFSEFRLPRESKTQIKLVKNPKHKSKPAEVLQRLRHYFTKNSLPGDTGWLVIDRDAWTEQELDDVHRHAREQGFTVVLSNPCFELWLYLHLRDPRPFNDRHDCQRRLAEVLPGYHPDSKGSYDAPRLLEGLDRALDRARTTDLEPRDRWPRAQATRVYQLVEHILCRNAGPSTE